MFFDTILNGIFYFNLFLIFHYQCIQMQQFYVLILYPATFLNSFISSNSFWVETLGFSTQNIMSFTNNKSFTSLLFICILFISFSCLIAMVRTSNTMLKRNDMSGHPCLITEFNRKAFSISLLSIMLAVGLSYMAFIMLSQVPSMPTFWSFYHKWC